MLYCASRSRTLRAASKIIAPSASGNGFSTTTRNTTSRCPRSEEHTSELQSRLHLVCRLLLGKKNGGMQDIEKLHRDRIVLQSRSNIRLSRSPSGSTVRPAPNPFFDILRQFTASPYVLTHLHS